MIRPDRPSHLVSRFSLTIWVCLLLALFLGLLAPLPVAAGDSRAVIHAGETEISKLVWTRTGDGTFVPSLPGARPVLETGKPLLPVQTLNLLVHPLGGIGGVEIVPLQTHRERLPGVLACGGELVSSEGDRKVVARLTIGATYPQVWGEYGGSHLFRGYRLVTVRLYPLRLILDYDGGWTEVEILDRYAVRLLPGPVGAPADLVQRERRVPGERERTERLLRPLLANPEALLGYPRQDGQSVPEPAGGFLPTPVPTLSGSAVRFLIITTADLAPAFEALASHKTEQSMPAVVVTVEWIESSFRHGADIQETMRLFLREGYEKWGLEYVLLGGDTDLLPCRYVTSTFHSPEGATDIPADLYFAGLDGNWNASGNHLFGEPYLDVANPGDDADLAEDIFVGRAPVSSLAAATVFVNKVITYSTTPAGSGWTNRNLFAAEVLFPNDYIPGDPIGLDGAQFSEGILADSILPCTSMESLRMYEAFGRLDTLGAPMYPGAIRLTRSALIDTLNNGRYGVLNQIGHGFFFNMSVGDAQFTNSDADGLTNGDNLFLIYAMNCASAAFDNGCLMERFLQNSSGGSVASIGSARAAFPSPSNEYQAEFFSQLFCQPAGRLGEVVTLSRLPFLPFTDVDSAERWTTLNYVLLGDPTLTLWTGPIQTVEVAAPDTLVAGAQAVTVTVTSGGTPVEGALVCLAKTGDDYVYGPTDVAGQVDLSFTPDSAGSALLTVTGQELEFTQQTVVVTTGEAFITVSDISLVDDGSDGSTGNANGELESGETVALFITCEDLGGGGATGVTGTIGTTSPGVTVLDDSVTVGDIGPGGTEPSADPFVLLIDPDLADGSGLDFDLFLTEDQRITHQLEFTLTALAPEVEAVELLWSDVIFGNGDGTMEDGEQLDVIVNLKNFGAGLADTVVGTLRTLDPEVTLYDSVVTYLDISLMETVGGSPLFRLADANVAVPSWCWIDFEDNHGRSSRHEFQLNPPGIPADLDADTSLGPDVIALSWAQVPEADLRGYHVYRSGNFEGPFERVSEDLVGGISYFRDDRLELLTRYYYQVTAVDSSLVEGEPSDVISRSTAPPEAAPFPLPFGVETSSHCAIGDIDGDGMLDIALGSDEIYVWSADGGELFDGDHDAQTHGPITDLNAVFRPAGLTLAELDHQPGHEIIASERNLRQIHVFRHDGSELPGWPQDLHQTGDHAWNWATPAVGDIDGDGQPEIVVNSLDGTTWVWHADGTELTDGDANPATNGVFVQRPEAANEWGLSSPALFDLDGDGAREIIFGTRFNVTGEEDNFLLAYRYDGSQASGFPYPVGKGAIVCSPSVADLDLDGIWEIVFISENDTLHVLQQDGTPYPGFPIDFLSNNGQVSCPSPAFGDFDEDGQLEIVAVSTSFGLSSWIYVLDTDVDGGTSGQPLAGWPRNVSGSSEGSPVVGDIDGDGRPDVVFGIGGGHAESPNNLHAFRHDGNDMGGFPITLGGPLRPAPVITDLDRDGDVDLVFGGWDKLIHVWDLPFPFDESHIPWPTFRGNPRRDGVFLLPQMVDVPTADPATEMLVMPPLPNPFNPTTTLRLFLPGGAGELDPVEVAVFDLRGRRVRTLHDGPAPAGWNSWVWRGRNTADAPQASGVYFFRVKSHGRTVAKKISLIK